MRTISSTAPRKHSTLHQSCTIALVHEGGHRREKTVRGDCEVKLLGPSEQELVGPC